MKMLTLLLVSAVFATAAADDQASKDQPSQGARSQFEALDRDGDERLSKSEVEAHDTLSGHFRYVDADADGYITKSEYKARVRTKPSS
jgi:Ca2+-binding EF-hand superfamily protein